MRQRLLDFLCCPTCGGSLVPEIWVGDLATEAEEGLLACDGCARTYPIINAIPRMLPDELVPMVVGYHADFFSRWPDATRAFVARGPKTPSSAWWDTQGRALHSYSYQWRKFKEMYPDWEQVFLDSIAPMTREFFAGRVGLDAGCGFGRSLHYAAKYGAEMIGLDLSDAIEAAR